jgi:hypothetical protein
MSLKYFAEQIKHWVRHSLSYYHRLSFLGAALPGTEIILESPDLSSADATFLRKGEALDARYPKYSLGIPNISSGLYLLNNAALVGRTGVVVTSSRSLLVESEVSYNRMILTGSFKRPYLTRYKILRGAYTSIHTHTSTAYSFNYYHWMLDALPRLYALKQLKDQCTLILPENSSEIETASILAFLKDIPQLVNTLPISNNETFLCEKMFFTPCISRDMCPPPRDPVLAYVKETLIKHMPDEYSANNRHGEMIYLSRSEMHRRRILNEEEFLPTLRALGFTILRPERMSLWEQIKCFQHAKVIIGAHGASLTNLIFSNDAYVCELFSSNYLHCHYMMLSKQLGHKYSYILGSAENAIQDFSIDELQVIDWARRIVQQ